MNRGDAARNDVDLKMVEFFNLNADYYQDITNIQKRDYFAQDLTQRETAASEDGKASTAEMAATAHDLLQIKRKV